ncbi:lamin tail domain-containing protein [Psychroserpens ponticola]|uniref:Lamin tail domain-containing protein n=1 Tax=Psychroserpens ponticola TaxID=2932268 RepID=A0ABY7RVL3_9FLAO|nr:lamin tail domain-containing protein [Psychroserpens ponticola]WCO01149.1 lamin tail domain-containing protein [Psychroserpens ponticola]
MKKIYTLLLALTMTSFGFAQTSPGDIAFTAFNADGTDEFAFVTLVDIPANTTIWFTDNEWDGDSFNNINEGEIEWSHTSAVLAGTVILIENTNGSSPTVNIGAVSGGGANLGASNEELFALLSEPSASVMPTPGFLAGIANDISGSVLTGTGLTEGTNFLNFDDDGDGYEYTGSISSESAFADYLPLIMDTDNWQIESSNGNLILPISTVAFTITGSATDTEVLFTGTSISISEGDGIFELEFTILNEDAAATSFDVVLTSGDNADIDGYTTETVTFPGGSAADQVVELTITDDAVFEADETLTFEIQNVSGGSNAGVGTNGSFDLTITNNDAPPTIALPYSEDFTNCGTALWTPYSEAADNSWTCAAGAYTMNGFPNPDDIDWLISSFSIDFDLTSNENIAVTTSEQHGDAINDAGEFELFYSTNYAGYGDPTGATWIPLTFNPNNTSTGFGTSPDSVTVVDATSITGTAYLAFYYDAAAGSGPEEWNITDILIQEGALPTSVELVSTSASVAEDSSTYDLEFSITNEDATNATIFDLVLTVGDAADIDSYTTQAVTFPAGTSANQTVTITITDDALQEADELLTFEIQNVTGGNTAAVGTNSSFDLTILENDEPVIEGTLYDADFSNDGDGFAAHTSSSPPAAGPASAGPFGTAPNAWSLSYDTTPGTDGSDNTFEVVLGELQSDDWGGQGIFTSQLIDVSGVNTVDISATGVNSGANENNFNYFYIIDGGSRVDAANISSSNGDPVNYSIIGLDVSGASTLEVGFEFFENGGGDGYDVSEFLVIEGATNTSVQLTSTSASVFEDVGTIDLTFEVLNEDAVNDTTFDVVLTVGDAADVNSYTTQTITFPAGPGPNQGLTITITDDMIEESTEVLTFEIQNVSGGDAAVVGANNSFELTIQDNDGSVVLPGDIVISEIMYNSTSFDDEWIEIYNASGADITLDGDWQLSYGSNTFDFTGTLITAGDYLTIALGSNGDGTYNNDNPFTPDVSAIATPAATTDNTNNLGNSSATIALVFEPSGANTTVDSVTYDDGAPWPTAADGNGPSLELIDVAFDNALGGSWVSSGDYDGGTPGAAYVAPIIFTFNGTWSPSDPNGAATAGDDIVIESGDAVIGSNTTCNSVTVNPGAGLTVNSGITLTATNGLTLESSSTSYSSLILDGTVDGTMTYQRHVNINASSGTTTGSNDLVSAPLTGQPFNTFAAANPNILTNAGGTLYLFGPFEKVTGQYVTWADTETSTLDPGVGYRAGSVDNDTFTFTGTANNGVVTNDLVNAGSNNAIWNLVGNPYPSYLNVWDFLAHDLGDGTTNIQLFDTGTEAIYGYDGSHGNGWTIYNFATTLPSTVIAPGQGFMVSANAAQTAGYDLEFSPDMRRTGSSDDFIVGRNAQLTYVKLDLSTANKSYGTDIYFNNNASSGFDAGYDAAIWGETAPDFAIYSHLIEENNGKAMALQAVNHNELSNISISLGVNANQGEQLRFSISEMTLQASVNVYLEDRVENTITLLNNTDYVITPSTPLSGTGRFFLRTSQEALSTIDNNLDNLTIYALNTSKEIVVNGQLKENTVFNLYDIQGRKVLSTKLDKTHLESRIDASSLTSGVYVVIVQNNSQQKTQKVIIK